MRIFGGSSSSKLTKKICAQLDQKIGQIHLEPFPSGERYCQYQENIRGEDVFLIQSLNTPTNDYLMELLVMIDAAKRSSAQRVTAVIPYLAYLRQDRKTKSREPITARLVAKMLETAGADRIIGMDFHCGQAQGFFDIPVDHLFAIPVIAEYVNGGIDIVVSPDVGGVKRAQAYARTLGAEIGFVDKTRISSTEISNSYLSGDVKDKIVLIPDDLTESSGTLLGSAEICKENGAKKVICAISHAVFTKTGKERLKDQKVIDELIFTDSVDNKVKVKGDFVTELSIAPLLAKAIKRTNRNESISALFEVKGF